MHREKLISGWSGFSWAQISNCLLREQKREKIENETRERREFRNKYEQEKHNGGKSVKSRKEIEKIVQRNKAKEKKKIEKKLEIFSEDWIWKNSKKKSRTEIKLMKEPYKRTGEECKWNIN